MAQETLVRKRMREVAILEFEGKLIASLREYWSSEVIADLETAEEFVEMTSTPEAQP